MSGHEEHHDAAPSAQAAPSGGGERYGGKPEMENTIRECVETGAETMLLTSPMKGSLEVVAKMPELTLGALGSAFRNMFTDFFSL